MPAVGRPFTAPSYRVLVAETVFGACAVGDRLGRTTIRAVVAWLKTTLARRDLDSRSMSTASIFRHIFPATA